MRYNKLLAIGIFLVLMTPSFAQEGGPDDPFEEDPDEIPIGDGDMLLTAGVVFGIRRLMKKGVDFK